MPEQSVAGLMGPGRLQTASPRESVGLLSLPSRGTLATSPNLSSPQLPHVRNKDYNTRLAGVVVKARTKMGNVSRAEPGIK